MKKVLSPSSARMIMMSEATKPSLKLSPVPSLALVSLVVAF